MKLLQHYEESGRYHHRHTPLRNATNDPSLDLRNVMMGEGGMVGRGRYVG